MISFEEKVSSFVNFVKAGNVVLVGSGASVDAGLMDWNALGYTAS